MEQLALKGLMLRNMFRITVQTTETYISYRAITDYLVVQKYIKPGPESDDAPSSLSSGSVFSIYTVSGKKVTPCVLFYYSDTGSRILTKFCANKLQTNHKISVKSVNNCKSYSGFSAGTQKLKRPL